ncbi:hypothetical protein RRG08_065361 [Elysia crispata]|uniref:Uncharacterized protein n=1 Tax=Elysia crispata TaxID=231223 RepID=A0AAE1AH14_9GAST|nr:hypothetical protein RRG08_065361 [Elysia crispata]
MVTLRIFPLVSVPHVETTGRNFLFTDHSVGNSNGLHWPVGLNEHNLLVFVHKMSQLTPVYYGAQIWAIIFREDDKAKFCVVTVSASHSEFVSGHETLPSRARPALRGSYTLP